MNTNQYKSKLLAEKATLEEELKGIGEKNSETGAWNAQPESQTAPEADENDLATRATDFEERSSMTDTLGERMKDIENALEKIENNTFGICEICGMKIEEDRLEANPAARTCEMCMNQ